MSEAILSAVVVAALAAAVILVHTMSRRSAPIADGSSVALTGQSEPEIASGSSAVAPHVDPDRRQWALVSDLSAAQYLLDWAEAKGYQELELIVLGNSTFLVRWLNRV